MSNGNVARDVHISRGAHRGRALTFIQHSDDRYTVHGLSTLPYIGISIERRQEEMEALMHDTGELYPLNAADKWLAHRTSQGRKCGILAVGATPAQAYRNSFNRFGY